MPIAAMCPVKNSHLPGLHATGVATESKIWPISRKQNFPTQGFQESDYFPD